MIISQQIEKPVFPKDRATELTDYLMDYFL